MRKRCHIVIHNLHHRVTLGEVSDRIQHLTGKPPLIAHQLYCARPRMTAFRVTCHYEHRDNLVGEQFGPHVKVSRYNYMRDRPPLGKIIHTSNITSSRPTPSPNVSPNPLQPPSTVNTRGGGQQDVNQLISYTRTHGYA